MMECICFILIASLIVVSGYVLEQQHKEIRKEINKITNILKDKNFEL